MAEQKTEKPTQRKLDQSRKEGRFPVSRQFVSAVQFLVFVWLLGAFGQTWFAAIRASARLTLQTAFKGEPTRASMANQAWLLVKSDFAPLMMAGLVFLGITVAAQLFATRLGISLSRLSPSWARLNPYSKIKELPKQNVPALVQSMILLPVFAVAAYSLSMEHWERFQRLPLLGIESAAGEIAVVLQTLLWRASAIFVLVGLVDLFRQQRRHNKDLRMSKQEIREEYKESEGNPQIKQRVRRLQRDLARRNMMKEVPNATAVIVNPTHFSVAIRYGLDSPGAPVVVAKGKNYMALRIKTRAIEHDVPIIENPPLAQALYKSVDVGQEIPADLYRAVAEVLAYIFRLMNGRQMNGPPMNGRSSGR